MARIRLDLLLVERSLVPSRQRAQALILAGRVLVEDVPVTNAGAQVKPDAQVRIRGEDLPFVSRGGLKLEAALEAFDVPVAGAVCADLGASTGGFTDCLLQRGAVHVYAIDVGYGQLDWKLRKDERVEVMERTNARHLETLPRAPSLVVGDLSFISLEKILPAIARIAAPDAHCVLLVKPQFEVGKEHVGKGGRVRDDSARLAAVQRVLAGARADGFAVLGELESPVPGAKAGNIEHLVWLRVPGSSRDILSCREETR